MQQIPVGYFTYGNVSFHVTLHTSHPLLPSPHVHMLILYVLGMILTITSCTMLQTFVHSSSGTLLIRSNPLNLFVTSTV